MTNKSSDEYVTQFRFNKSRSCWELDKENKIIGICDIGKLSASFPESYGPSWGLPDSNSVSVPIDIGPPNGIGSVFSPNTVKRTKNRVLFHLGLNSGKYKCGITMNPRKKDG